MKIVSWNVNGLRAVERKGSIQDMLKKLKPDVVVLQEIKGKIDQFSDYLVENDEYSTHYHSAEKAGYSGVAAWVKKDLEVVDVVKGIPDEKDYSDTEGRVIRVDIKKGDDVVSVVGVYVPNGGKSEEAYELKLKFFSQLFSYIKRHNKINLTVLGGDLNCAEEEIDLSEPEKHRKNVNFRDDCREIFSQYKKFDLVDSFRHFYPEEECYTYWDNFDFSLPKGTKPRSVNRGWRIDYFLVPKSLIDDVKKVSIHNEIFGSDHCPVSVEI